MLLIFVLNLLCWFGLCVGGLVGDGVVRWWFGSWVVGGLVGDGDVRGWFGSRVVGGGLVGDDGDTVTRLVVLLLWWLARKGHG